MAISKRGEASRGFNRINSFFGSGHEFNEFDEFDEFDEFIEFNEFIEGYGGVHFTDFLAAHGLWRKAFRAPTVLLFSCELAALDFAELGAWGVGGWLFSYF